MEAKMAIFHRKQYKEIAEIIVNAQLLNSDKEKLARLFSEYFRKDNPVFDDSKWYPACGVK